MTANFQTSSPVAMKHRREHRMGAPAKLACDPELRAFVEERLATMTFKQVADEVARSFEPARHVSPSTVYRWWRRLKGRPLES